MKRLNSDSALTFKSSHAAACGMRSFIASHFLSASLIAGLSARTALVIAPNERRDESASRSSRSAAGPAFTAKVVNNNNERVIVFIDPERRLKQRRAEKWAHHGRQRP